jgi:hypothetical protein
MAQLPTALHGSLSFLSFLITTTHHNPLDIHLLSYRYTFTLVLAFHPLSLLQYQHHTIPVHTSHLPAMESCKSTASATEPLVKCCACWDDLPRDTTIAISSDFYCHTCLRRRFQLALDDENNWPAKLGDEVLEPKNFLREGVVSPAFLEAYKQKEREYNCPKHRRIYCPWPSVLTPSQGTADQAVEPCQTFVDEKIPRSGNFDYAITVCQKCHRLSCQLCGGR